jgi:peptidoglycan/LPS O-acetylase OafA/YrhL
LIFPFKSITQKNTLPVLDGVRAVACLSVISYHIHYFLAHDYDLNAALGQLATAIGMAGWSGVTLFFVLSGFLLFQPFAKALLFEKPWPSTRTFYMRRALRILPGYYVALLVLIALTQPAYLQPDHWKETLLFVTFFMDATSATYQQINGPFWTLAVEWQFYLLLPLLALGFAALVKRATSPQRRWWWLLGCLLAMIVWGVGTRFLGRYYTLHPTETLLVPRSLLNIILMLVYGTSGKYLEDFAVGMLISACYALAQHAVAGQTLRVYLLRYSPWLWRVGILWLCLMMTWYIFPFLSILSPLFGAGSWMTELGYALGFGLCVTALLFGPAHLKGWFELQPLCWIGTISYSLYIWHLPLLLLFRGITEPYINGWSFLAVYTLQGVCVLLVIIPFSFLFYSLIERPGIQIAHKGRQREGS